jgi:hypothetical protein
MTGKSDVIRILGPLLLLLDPEHPQSANQHKEYRAHFLRQAHRQSSVWVNYLDLYCEVSMPHYLGTHRWHKLLGKGGQWASALVQTAAVTVDDRGWDVMHLKHLDCIDGSTAERSRS